MDSFGRKNLAGDDLPNMITSLANDASVDKSEAMLSSVLANGEADLQRISPETVLEDPNILFVGKQIMESIVSTTLPLVTTAFVTLVEEIVKDTPIGRETTTSYTSTGYPTNTISPAAPLFNEGGLVPLQRRTQGKNQPLADILKLHPITVSPGGACDIQQIDRSIDQLDCLISVLEELDHETANFGIAPGFETRLCCAEGASFQAACCWVNTNTKTPYQILDQLNSKSSKMTGGEMMVMPQPSPAVAIKCYLNIKRVWEARKRYVQETMFKQNSQEQFCSCIREWTHSSGDVMIQIANQSLEQAMIREASACVSARMLQHGHQKGEVWDKLYEPHTCIILEPETGENLYIPSTPVHLISGRDDYVHSFSNMAVNAMKSVDVATCYVFHHDPAQRYILLDLLPFIAMSGIKVRLCIDLMTVESAIIKSAFNVRKTGEVEKKIFRGATDPLSFLSGLPNKCPTMSDEARVRPETPHAFLQKVLHIASSIPDDNFQIRWWCARDVQDGYRIKNHAKCAVFDSQNRSSPVVAASAFIGGSNLVPSLESGDSDCDLIVTGVVAQQVAGTFNYLWESLEETTKNANLKTSTKVLSPIHEYSPPSPSNTLKSTCKDTPGLLPHQKWLDNAASVRFVRSVPSSAGEDAILRHILGSISTAQKAVYMCMGHCNFPKPFTLAVREACNRGAHVELLVNSLYSSDLRVNQRDMFLSLKELLSVAPDVEVWTTALSSVRQNHVCTDSSEHDTAPPFLHSKYIVIDGKWCAVGSWKLWTRSAFHEIEHELLIKSTTIALKLESKFKKERNESSSRLFRPEECLPGAGFCPEGCQLCQPFGPFYTNRI